MGNEIHRAHEAAQTPHWDSTADGSITQASLDRDKNAEAYAELCLSLDDKSLLLIMQEGKMTAD